VHLESPALGEQIAQIARMFPLDFSRTLFSRCSRCNETLGGPLPREAVVEELPPRVREWREEFHKCPKCGGVYWEGTHSQRIRARLREWLGRAM